MDTQNRQFSGSLGITFRWHFLAHRKRRYVPHTPFDYRANQTHPSHVSFHSRRKNTQSPPMDKGYAVTECDNEHIPVSR